MKTNEMLSNHQFHIKKKFGQNFLNSEDILAKIAKAGELDETVGVIEIGPGLGSLTKHLATRAKQVLCYEIDNDLAPILKENLATYKNVHVLYQDILQAKVNEDILEYLGDCQKIYVVANLPYYITTPILLNLLHNVPRIEKYIVMMQLEVAQRIAGSTCSKDYNSLSIAIQYRASVKKLFNVSRNVFVPAPNVDSAVIEIKVYDKPIYKAKNENFFFSVVRNSFEQRRKTLVNNLMNAYQLSREKFLSILSDLGIKENARSEELSIDDFIKLSDYLLELFNENEKLDLYDENGVLIDKDFQRGKSLKEGEYIKIVLAVLKNKKEYLIQKRASNKSSFPNMWDIVGGIVQKGETEDMAVCREIKEEMGIETKTVKLIDYDLADQKFFRYIYSCEIERDARIKIDRKEVSEYRWVNIKEIEKLVEAKKFVLRDYEVIKKYSL